MSRRRYAESTTVTVERSQAELVRLLKAHGARQHAVASDNEDGRASIIFALGGRQIRFSLDVPTAECFARDANVDPPRGWVSGSRAWRQAWCQRQRAQAERQRWRALVLVTKAKLELIAEGLSTVEREFLADVLLPNGKTLGDAIAPQLEETYVTGRMPPLLPAAGKRGR